VAVKHKDEPLSTLHSTSWLAVSAPSQMA